MPRTEQPETIAGAGDLHELLVALTDRVHAAGAELCVRRRRLRIVTSTGRSARQVLGILLYSDVHVFARRLCAWLHPARCTRCAQREVPRLGGECERCTPPRA